MCESLPVELVYNNDTFSILGIYRPPSTSLEILKHYNMFMDNDRNKYMAIIGDFNINTLAHSFSNQVNQFLDDDFLLLINIPTRITETSATCIVHVYINQLSLISMVQLSWNI